jgi:hypothetical protein
VRNDLPPYAGTFVGYDHEDEHALVNAISDAIGRASLIDDDGRTVMAIRTAEIAGALLTVLASTLAMSPSATRSPSAIRELTAKLRKRLIKHVADARRDPEIRDFVERCFRDDDEKRSGHG